MNDHVEIANLIYSYAERIDLGDFAGVGALFEHALITTDPAQGTETRGSEAATRMYTDWTRRYADPRSPTGHTLHTKHVTTNLQIHLDSAGRSARTRCYFSVLMQTETLPLQPIVAGRYHDEFEKRDGRWRFTRRHILTDLVGNLSEHLLLTLG
ncbi:MAG: nuclear transport factor 2 family protein [Myxococcales bacterium]|nr:MAG: nuclear transport factor 2 family protein [Myxococcales bacterium]